MLILAILSAAGAGVFLGCFIAASWGRNGGASQ